MATVSSLSRGLQVTSEREYVNICNNAGSPVRPPTPCLWTPHSLLGSNAQLSVPASRSSTTACKLLIPPIRGPGDGGDRDGSRTCSPSRGRPLPDQGVAPADGRRQEQQDFERRIHEVHGSRIRCPGHEQGWWTGRRRVDRCARTAIGTSVEPQAIPAIKTPTPSILIGSPVSAP
jgi:hypothetical protein